MWTEDVYRVACCSLEITVDPSKSEQHRGVMSRRASLRVAVVGLIAVGLGAVLLRDEPLRNERRLYGDAGPAGAAGGPGGRIVVSDRAQVMVRPTSCMLVGGVPACGLIRPALSPS